MYLSLMILTILLATLIISFSNHSSTSTFNSSYSFHSFRKSNYNQIIYLLSSYDRASTLSNLDLNSVVNTFTDALHSSFLCFVPISSFLKFTFPPWVSRQLKVLVNRKKNLTQSINQHLTLVIIVLFPHAVQNINTSLRNLLKSLLNAN